MSITHSEIASSGISSDNFDDIYSAIDGLVMDVEVSRLHPSFSVHDTIGRSSELLFSAAADDTKVLRVYNDAGSVYVEYLLVENVDPAIVGTWSSPNLITADALPGLMPKVVKQDSGDWDVFVLLDTGIVTRYTSATGTGSWADSDFSAIALATDGTIKWITYGGGLEVVYFIKYLDTTGVYVLWEMTSTEAASSGILWPEPITGFDCQEFVDTSDDADGILDDSSVRHLLVMSAPMPSVYSYALDGGSPIKKSEKAGGVISFIARPYAQTTLPAISRCEHIHVYDKQTALQYRSTCHAASDSSIFSSSKKDTLFVACIGGDGDENGADESFGYSAIYYYSSRDGRFWSQDRIVPIEDISSLNNFTSGCQLVRCNNYLYILSATTTLRSLASREFGQVHPDWVQNLTDRVTQYSSSMQDIRQTSMTLGNPNDILGGTLLLSGASLAMVTKFGRYVPEDEEVYLFQVAIEHVDSVEEDKDLGSRYVNLSARDRLCWLTDKVASLDALQYDSHISGIDRFKDIDGIAQSGMSHSAVVTGSCKTEDGTLRSIGRYKESVIFNTFESMVADGAAQTTFVLPNPIFHEAESPVNSMTCPTYAGIIFRAIDKDNFMYLKYDYWLQEIVMGSKRNGTTLTHQTVAPSAWFIDRVEAEEPVSIRIQFRHNFLMIWTSDEDGTLHLLTNMNLYGVFPTVPPMMQGYVGMIACGFSDEDQGAEFEPDPISLWSDGGGLGGMWLTRGTGKIFLIGSDGYIYRTADFDSLSPTYDRASLGVSGTVVGFVGNPFCAKYLGSGSDVSGWVVTTTGIYFVSDLGGTPSASLQKSFRAVCSRRSIDSSFGSEGYAECRSAYSDGVYATHTIDGSTWSSEVLVGSATAAIANFPGEAIRQRTAGSAYGSAFFGGDPDGVKASANFGTQSAISSPNIDPLNDLVGDIHIPYGGNSNEQIAYYGSRGNAVAISYIAGTTGPSEAHEGEIVIIHSDTGTPFQCATIYGMNFALSACCHIEIVSIDATLFACQPTNNTVWGYHDCANVHHSPGTVSSGANLAPVGAEYDVIDWSHTSLSAFTVSVRITNIPDGAGSASERKLIRVKGLINQDISPEYAGELYGPNQSRQLSSDPLNRQRMVYALVNDDLSKAGIWTTEDAGNSTHVLVPPATPGYNRAAMSGDGEAVVYIFGKSGKIGYSSDRLTVQDKMGNIGTFSPGDIVNIGGL